VVGVSSDSIASHDDWANAETLPFTLLSDPEQSLRELLGVRDSLFGLLPARVTFVIGQDGRLHGLYRSQIFLQRHVDHSIEVLQGMPASQHVRAPLTARVG
jgi:peroxiredoxin Q/BCP